MQYLRSAHSYAKIQVALFKGKRPVGAAGAQVPYKHKVTGSNPVPATIELSQVRQVFCLTCFLFRIKFATHLATPFATQQSFRVMNAVFDGLIKRMRGHPAADCIGDTSQQGKGAPAEGRRQHQATAPRTKQNPDDLEKIIRVSHSSSLIKESMPCAKRAQPNAALR